MCGTIDSVQVTYILFLPTTPFFLSYISIACNITLLLSKSFSQVILDTYRLAESSGHSIVDVSLDDRLKRCRVCLVGFQQVSQILGDMLGVGGKVGQLIREVHRELEPLMELRV